MKRIDAIAQNIKYIRELRNFDQKYMAEGLGISQAYYSRMEKGLRDIGIHQLKKIAKLLQVEWYVLENFDVEECLSVFQKQEEITPNAIYENKKGVGYTLHFGTENSVQKVVSINRYYRHYFLPLIRHQKLCCYSS